MKSSKASKQCQSRINKLEPTQARISGDICSSLFSHCLKQKELLTIAFV